MKRLILDLDDTLIDWKENYWDCVNRALDCLHIPYDANWLQNFSQAIAKYETECDYYNMEEMLQYINEGTKSNLSMEFMEKWQDNLAEAVPEKLPIEIKETLEYLSQKYDLVVLSNWFSFSQINRLKNTGILQYFSHVYCAENFKMKPNPEAFYVAKGEYNIEDCIMIGDDLKMDIEGAIKVGMKAIFYNKKNSDTILNCQMIYRFEELKDIL